MPHSIEWSEPPSFRKQEKRKDVVFTCRNCRRPNFQNRDNCAHCGAPRKPKK